MGTDRQGMECNPVMERSIKVKETEDASHPHIKIQKEQHKTAKQMISPGFFSPKPISWPATTWSKCPLWGIWINFTITFLGNSWGTAQLAASQGGLSSMKSLLIHTYIIYSILSFTDFCYVLNMFYQATYFHCEFHIFFSLQNCNPHKYEEFIVITVTYDHQNPLQLKCIMLRNIKWLWMRLSQTTVWCQFGSWPKNWWITQQAWTPMNLQYEMKIIIKPFT